MHIPYAKRVSPWLLSIRPAQPPCTRLFCFPHAGGSAHLYQRWAPHAAENLDFWAVELPGRGHRFAEPAFTQIPQLIPVLTENLIPWLTPPFAFFGHSMGAILAFELTVELARRRLPGPRHLFVSGRRAPGLPERRLPCHALNDREFKCELRNLGGTSPDALENDELMDVLLPVLRADFQMCETYAWTPGGPVDTPITVFGGLDDEDTTTEELEAWRNHTSRFGGVFRYAGDHFFVDGREAELLKIASRQLEAWR